ncbi:endonuclease III DNA glycosylase/apyrimidinic (AP) lyase [[Clostridium] ultunense Esp]|uniref:Endonuclease III n=1 Tax=[Clostridium] ultunense Esp TaxID=1288971 RepID=M1ZBV6_9FIRM|nr:endonuclease III [Schnuerera ultunensis]CCQ95253.1 endonuclease III DNA glycosylase/apyrimidinic (AP) lyase [[Clostridium] ultunense Esp]SHD75861.1 endonuclease III [[Clostridium] ultunense Esp]
MKKILTKEEIKEVIDILMELYPDAKAELNYSNPFELLVATILSAQCTDVQVNKTTEKLFKEFKTPEDYLKLTEEELGQKIRSCGFYKTKSKNILATCRLLIEKFNGEVPGTLEELITLPGVGRKTANVVLSNAFSKPAIAVGTHVFRVSNRIGLADSKNVLDTEKDLMDNIDKEMWSKAHHLLIFHGRRICKARRPLCDKCPLTDYCFYYREEVNKE